MKDIPAAAWLREVADMLNEKAASYGNSIDSPVQIFYKGSKLDGIRARLDDKASRIKHGKGYPGDNDYKDFVGYMAILATTKE